MSDMVVVMVGFGVALIPAIDRALPPGSLVIVDDGDVIAARGLRAKAAAFACVLGVIEAPIQDEAAAAEVMAAVALPDGVTAVIPGQEYGVVGAAVLADALGLPGAGAGAARTLRDKIALRTAIDRTSLDQPRWREVRSPADIRDFGAASFVLKPANRQASVGVQLLTAGDDLDLAWQRTVEAGEPLMAAPRRFRPRYLVETRLHGPEVSVEAFAHLGKIVFANITAKSVLPGTHPVELSHVLPAALPADTAERLHAALRTMVAAIGFRSGTLHSEWILVKGVPHLIECAGRLPGDEIIPLIDLAYGGNLVADLITVLSGDAPRRADTATRAAAVHFLTGTPGLITRVEGADRARAVEGVVDVRVTAVVGQRVPPMSSSWDRVGRVIAVGPDGTCAAATAAEAAAAITIATVDVDAIAVTDPRTAAPWWPARPDDPRDGLAWAAGASDPLVFLGLRDGPALWLRGPVDPPGRMNAVEVVSGAAAGLAVDADSIRALRAAYPAQTVCAATGYGSPLVRAGAVRDGALDHLVGTFLSVAASRSSMPAVLHCPAGDPLLDAVAGRGFQTGMTDLYPILELPGADVGDYLAALSKSHRGNVRREMAARAGGRTGIYVGAQARPHLAVAARLNACGYQQRGGHRDEAEVLAVYEHLLAETGDDLVLTLACVGDDPVASATLVVGATDLLLYSAGLVLPGSRAVAGYFNAAYYLPIEFAYARGLRRILLGPTGWQTKRLRGARFTPLYSAVPAEAEPLADMLVETDARLREVLALMGGDIADRGDR